MAGAGIAGIGIAGIGIAGIGIAGREIAGREIAAGKPQLGGQPMPLGDAPVNSAGDGVLGSGVRHVYALFGSQSADLCFALPLIAVSKHSGHWAQDLVDRTKSRWRCGTKG